MSLCLRCGGRAACRLGWLGREYPGPARATGCGAEALRRALLRRLHPDPRLGLRVTSTLPENSVLLNLGWETDFVHGPVT